MTELVELALFAAAVIAALTWVAVVLAAPRRTQPGAGPAARAALARAWLYAPIWVPILVVFAALAPGIAGALGLLGDHCLSHSGGDHHHLCLAHPPHESGMWLTWLVPLAISAAAVFALAACARRSWVQWRLSNALVSLSSPSKLGERVRLVDQDEPVALTLGLLSPTILVSTGLLRQASERTLAAVLAHEQAHIARRDTLLSVLDQFAASLLPRSVTKDLLDAIVLAREQSCDARAAKTLGATRVAAALAEVANLGWMTPAVGLSVVSSPLQARVLHLLYPPEASSRWMIPPVLVVVALAAIGLGPGHSALEMLISVFPH